MTSRARPALDPLKPWQFFTEEERSRDGVIQAVNTVFLTNRECPWRCVFCDLWKNTLTESVSPGAIPRQIEYALERMPSAPVIKLFNSGSFFDPRAIPATDRPAIAKLVEGFDRVIVENHPALVNDNCLRFRDSIGGRLEIAMGLETVNPEILPQIQKGMTLEQFIQAANFLTSNEIDLRAFILVDEAEAGHWARRSLEFAFSRGATVASLIPVRTDAQSTFTPPRIETLEACQEYGLGLRQGRVFSDLWDLERFSTCGTCYSARHARLREMNLTQTIPPPTQCDCGAPA